jgi:hypothetical protein
MTIHPTSVIVCTHNRADLLPNTIARLRAQDYPSAAFEIIVVDNCCLDHTPQVVERLVTMPGVTVRYIAESRLGITFARNRGAEEARYPYLAYLDDDCSVEPDWLSELVQGFDLYDDVVVVGGRVVLDWSQTEKPSWLGSGLEPWLGANSHLGSRPRLLDAKTQVMEGNMALRGMGGEWWFPGHGAVWQPTHGCRRGPVSPSTTPPTEWPDCLRSTSCGPTPYGHMHSTQVSAAGLLAGGLRWHTGLSSSWRFPAVNNWS